MLNHYSDILDRINEDPQWFDANGVPRFCEAHPDNGSNIYAQKVAFYRIECQMCSHPFIVEFNTCSMDEVRFKMVYGQDKDYVWDPENLHYGDPPNIGCCPAGPTMNSCPRELIALWERRNKPHWDWVKTKENIPVHAEWDHE